MENIQIILGNFTELFQNFQKRQYFALVQKVTDWLAESQGW